MASVPRMFIVVLSKEATERSYVDLPRSTVSKLYLRSQIQHGSREVSRNLAMAVDTVPSHGLQSLLSIDNKRSVLACLNLELVPNRVSRRAVLSS